MPSKRVSEWFQLSLVVIILALHFYAAASDAYNLPNAWFSRDDAYYYFKVAQNISEGRGITFDGINPTNGFHPLWMLICIPVFSLARYDLILPLRVLLLLIAGMQAATAVLLFRLTARSLALPVAMLISAYWAFDTRLHYTVYEFGLETPLAALTILVLLTLLADFEQRGGTGDTPLRKIAGLAAAATVMVFSRLDLVFLALLAGAWAILRGRPIRYLLPLDILAIAAAMLSSYVLLSGLPSYYANSQAALISTLLSLAIKLPILFAFGLYQHPRLRLPRAHLLRILLAAAVSAAALQAALLAVQATGLVPGISQGAALLDVPISLSLIAVLRLLGFGLTRGATPDAVRSPTEDLRRDWRRWAIDASVFYGVLGGALAIYAVWNRLAFGSWIPISAVIKRWWGSQLHTIYDGPAGDLRSFFGFGLRSTLNAWQPASDFFLEISRELRLLLPGLALRDERDLLAIILVVALAGAIILARGKSSLRAIGMLGLVPLLSGSALQILSYTASAYSGYKEWYWIGQWLLIAVGSGLMLHLVISPLQSRPVWRVLTYGASILASATLAFNLGNTITNKMPHGRSPVDRPFLDVLTFLESRTPSGAVIGMTGGGNIGYLVRERVIVNMDGLINSSEYYRALRAGTAAGYLSAHDVQIVFANPGILSQPPYDGQFAPYLERFDGFGGKALLWLLPEPKYQ